MASRSPNAVVVLLVLVSAALFVALPVWGWGDLGGFIDHPARVGACLAAILASLAALFSGANLGGDLGADRRTPLILVPVIVFSLLMAWLPAYADRRGILTPDGNLGEVSRYVGLALLIAGCILRVGPMFDLGARFRPPWIKQEKHRLVTTGFYQYIRNPSYLGGFLGMMGWFLVFRCAIGFLLSLVLVPLAIPMIRKEEAMLEEEFGEEYTAYKQRTWRLIPFVN